MRANMVTLNDQSFCNWFFIILKIYPYKNSNCKLKNIKCEIKSLIDNFKFLPDNPNSVTQILPHGNTVSFSNLGYHTENVFLINVFLVHFMYENPF